MLQNKVISNNSTNLSRVMSYKEKIQILIQLGFSPVILSGGMPRSGSTLLFNIIRLCLETKYGEELVSGYFRGSHALDRPNISHGKAYLLKAHDIGSIRYRANHIFYSYRDIRDAMVSYRLKFGDRGWSVSIGTARNWIAQYNQVKTSSKCLILKYEEFTNNLPTAIEQISHRLDIKTNSMSIFENLPKKYTDTSYALDSKTLMYGGHSSGTISGQWREVLSEKLQKRLIEEFGWWFEENGYDLE